MQRQKTAQSRAEMGRDIHERCSLVHLHQFTPLTWSQASPPWRMLQQRPRVTVPTQPERSRECVSRSSGGTESHGNQTRQQRPLAGGPQRWDRCAPAWQLPLRGVHLSVTHLLKPLPLPRHSVNFPPPVSTRRTTVSSCLPTNTLATPPTPPLSSPPSPVPSPQTTGLSPFLPLRLSCFCSGSKLDMLTLEPP